jgi:di/tricarboxylate transporter
VAAPVGLESFRSNGGYRFGDYWRLGLPLLALFGVVAGSPGALIWSF